MTKNKSHPVITMLLTWIWIVSHDVSFPRPVQNHLDLEYRLQKTTYCSPSPPPRIHNHRLPKSEGLQKRGIYLTPIHYTYSGNGGGNLEGNWKCSWTKKKKQKTTGSQQNYPSTTKVHNSQEFLNNLSANQYKPRSSNKSTVLSSLSGYLTAAYNYILSLFLFLLWYWNKYYRAGLFNVSATDILDYTILII